jgi:hypothetical protein
MSSLDLKLELLEALEEKFYATCRNDLCMFAETVEVPGAPSEADPDDPLAKKLELAEHHRLILDAVQAMMDGSEEIDGLLINMPPGSAKSTFGSVVVPAWALGRRKGTNVIAVTYGQELTYRFARRVRSICQSPIYENIMGAHVAEGNTAVEQWSLNNGSDYKASAIGAAITGMRADLVVIDDPVKDREAADSDLIREKTWSAYIDNVSTRLKPGGKIVMILTRWHEDDLAGRLLGEKWKGQSGLWKMTDGRLFRIINLPMVAEHKDDPLGRAVGEQLWKEWFLPTEVARLKKMAEGGGTAARTWSSLYQQRPAPDEGAILARHYWQVWEKKVPECDHVFLCYDTAFEEDEDADFSAMTAWGIFPHTSRKPGRSGLMEYAHNHVILLGAWQERVSAADLLDHVRMHYKLFRPDRILVEKRASGIQLIQEMQRLRLPVKQWLPPGKPGAKGKVPRAHAVAAMLEQGSVHVYPGPRTDMVLDQCSAFPYGTHDDLVDTVTMALSYFRRSGMFQSADEELEEDELTDAMAANLERKRFKRSLYSGRPGNSDYDDEERLVKNMTKDTRRRLYGD